MAFDLKVGTSSSSPPGTKESMPRPEEEEGPQQELGVPWDTPVRDPELDGDMRPVDE